MAIKKAHAYDTIAKQWIGRVPVSWFTTFPHLAHEGPKGERPDVPKIRIRADVSQLVDGLNDVKESAAAAASLMDKPLEELTVKQLRTYAAAEGVDLAGVTKKADILALLAGAPVGGD